MRERKRSPQEREFRQSSGNSYPSVLWILPIFYGFLGGTIAALIAGIKYEASWWQLFIVGIIINLLAVLIPFLIFGAAVFSIFR